MAANKQQIAVLGAGIMGLCAARALISAGHAVTLYDPRGFPASGNASAMAGGMLAPFAECEHLPASHRPAALSAIKVWQELLGPRRAPQKGSLVLAHKEDAHMLDRFAAHLPEKSAEVINAAQLRLLEPHLAGRFDRALYICNEAHLDPAAAMLELCRALDKDGVTFEENEIHPAAAANEYDLVIDCRGAAAVQNDPELRAVKGEILTVENREFELSRPIRLMHPRYPLYIVPRENFIFTIGATVIESTGDKVSVRSALELLSALYALHPSFAESKILDLKAGQRPAYPDNLPRITRRENVISCNGLFRHGYLLAPAMAASLAALVDGKQNPFTSLFYREENESHDQRHIENLSSAA